MIQQSITLYDEPQTVIVTNNTKKDFGSDLYHSYRTGFSPLVILENVAKARELGFTVGKKYKPKDTNSVFTIVGYVTNPETVEGWLQEPCVVVATQEFLVGNRHTQFNYSVNELINLKLEEIK